MTKFRDNIQVEPHFYVKEWLRSADAPAVGVNRGNTQTNAIENVGILDRCLGKTAQTGFCLNKRRNYPTQPKQVLHRLFALKKTGISTRL